MRDTNSEEIRRRFAEAVSIPDHDVNLAETALLIASTEYPGLDVTAYLRMLDDFAQIVHENDRTMPGPLAGIRSLNTTLFEQLGFRGNESDYYDPRNSFLNDVLDRRTGIPITLSVVYIEVARRIGIPVQGVGLPMHFIVKYAGEDGEVFIDPFHQGQLMLADDCARLVADMTDGQQEFKSEYLTPSTNRQILRRMLANLQAIYTRNSDYRRALSIVELGLLLDKDSPSLVRDRGLLLRVLGWDAQASEELARYLALSPAAADSESIRELLRALRQTLASLN